MCQPGGGCQPASALLWSPQYTKRVPQVILPTIGPLQLGSRCTGYTPSSSMTDWWPGLRSMARAAQFRLASARVNHPFITSSPCVISSTGQCCSSAPCSCHLWIFQKAYDTAQHGWLWALEAIGVGPKMLAAIKSLYASGTLSMKVGGVAKPSLVQQNGVRQDCPLSPTLFGILFDGLHGHLDRSLPHAGLQLGSGRWVSALVYADDVVLLSWTAAGLQGLLDSMHAFCLGLGLTISPFKD